MGMERGRELINGTRVETGGSHDLLHLTARPTGSGDLYGAWPAHQLSLPLLAFSLPSSAFSLPSSAFHFLALCLHFPLPSSALFLCFDFL